MKGECGGELPAVPWVGMLYHFHPSSDFIYWNLVVAVDDNNISICTLNNWGWNHIDEAVINDIALEDWPELVEDRLDELHLAK